MKIHMDTEQIDELQGKLSNFSHFLYHSTDELKSQANQMAWTGPGADDFLRQNLAVCGRVHTLAEDVAKTYMDLRMEKEQWVNVDHQGVFRLKRVTDVPKARQDPTLGMYIDAYTDMLENRRYNKKYQEFVKWWKDQTLEEKEQYLQNLQERLAERYGMPKVLVVIDDLPDSPNSDWRGVNIGGVLMVDEDNMNTEDPWRLIETVFHETRHEYQREVVDNYQNNRMIPEGLTQRQVEKWGNEFENYIGGEDNFKDYYNQAIEKDARDFGDRVMKDFLNEMGQGGSGGGSW